MWGFEWSNAEVGEEAVVTCPDGQGESWYTLINCVAYL